MNDQYLYCGKSVDDGDLVYGFLIIDEHDHFFENQNYHWLCSMEFGELIKTAVYPETLGRCSGIRSKTGPYIYEGHVVKDSDITYTVRFGEHSNDDGYTGLGFYLWHENPNYAGQLDPSDGDVLTLLGFEWNM